MSRADPNGGGAQAPDAQAPTGRAAWHQELFRRIAGWSWLGTLNEQVSAVVQPAYERFRDNPVTELLHGGRWTGHALHPALSDLPIGLWSGVVLLDALGKDTGEAETRGKGSTRKGSSGKGSPSKRSAGKRSAGRESPRNNRMDPAATLSAAGLLAAAGTAVTGLADWNVSDGEDRRVGLFHGVLNVAGVALQGASLAARLSGHRGSARALGAASMGVTAAAGYIGGHLVQGRALMVNRVAGSTGPNRWVAAIAETELAEATPTDAEVDGRRVLLYRDGEELHAIENICTHAGALLSRGEVDGCVVECPWHGSRFDLRDGQVVRGPAHHPQPALPVRTRKGWIEVRGSAPPSRRARQ